MEPDPLLGKQLGAYLVQSKIGEGGMAYVYKAYHPRLRREVAIKVIHSQIVDSANFKARFEREAQVVASLEHPNIVSVYDFGEEGNLSYLAMQYVGGGTLRDRLLNKRPLELQQAINYTLQIVHALHHAHLRGVVHRDVKPQNMLISATNSDHILLSDFGIAKIYASEDTHLTEMPTDPGAHNPALTGVNQIIGTADYMSPEQATSRAVDARADIYALGVVLYQMLTGDVPFHSTTLRGLLFHQVSTPAPSVRTKNPQIPETLAQIIAKALAKSPDDRFQTAEEMAHALEAIVASSPDLHITIHTTYASFHQATTIPDTVCPNCDTTIDSRCNFCYNCGYFLKTPPSHERTILSTRQAASPTQPIIDSYSTVYSLPDPVEGSEQPHDSYATVSIPSVPTNRIEQPQTPPTYTCPCCGIEIRQGHRFCLGCGYKLRADETVLRQKPPTGMEVTVAASPASIYLRTKIEEPARFLIHNTSEAIVREHILDQRAAVIGRMDACDISLTNDKFIARRHATVRYNNGAYLLHDEGSATGTFVNGHEIDVWTLKDLDRVEIGQYELIFMTFATASQADYPTLLLSEQVEGTIGTRFSAHLDSPFATLPSEALPEGEVPLEEASPAEGSIFAEEVLPPIITSGQTVAQLLEEGTNYYKTKRYESALEIFSQILRIDADNVEAHGNKGNVLGRMKRYREALAAYDAALAISEKHVSIWNSKGDVLLKQKRYEEALKAYNTALKINPNDVRTLTTKSEVLSRLRRYEEALAVCEQALKINTTYARTWIIKGNVLSKQRCYEEALRAYNAALEIDLADASIWMIKGKLLSKQCRYEDALAAFTQAAELTPKKYQIWTAKGEALLQLKRYEEAREAYQRAHILNPTDTGIARTCTLLSDLQRHKDELEQKRAQSYPAEEPLARGTPTKALSLNEVEEEQMPQAQVRESLPQEYPGQERENVEDGTEFDIFLSYFMSDSACVKWIEDELASYLEDTYAFHVWLPKWRLVPGMLLEPAWHQGMEQSRCYAICVSSKTPLDWFKQEVQRALKRKQEYPSFRVLAVLLPDGQEIDTDAFPDIITWVDFCHLSHAYALHTLVSGIRGVPPGSPFKAQMDATDSGAGTIAEVRLRELQQFKDKKLIDDNVVQEFQRIVLKNIWLDIKESKG